MRRIEGQQTNERRRREKVMVTKPIDMTGKTWVKDNSFPVNTWILKKKTKTNATH